MVRAYLSLIILLSLCACHKDKDTGNRNFTDSDREFMVAASYFNRAQVALGAWAVTKGSIESVRAFGQTMALSYQNAQNELFSLADSFRDSLPRQPDEDQLAIASQIATLSGSAFDAAYIDSQLANLSAMISLYEQYESAESDVQLKDYAGKYLLQMKQHLRGAELIKESL
jgi:putative membrane protein